MTDNNNNKPQDQEMQPIKKNSNSHKHAHFQPLDIDSTNEKQELKELIKSNCSFQQEDEEEEHDIHNHQDSNIQEEEDSEDDDDDNNIKKRSFKKLYKAMLPFSILSYGGPMAHISMLEQKFVEQLKWIKKDQFTELFALCQSMPGPTSTQLVIAIGSLTTRSALGGLLSFLIFSLPAALVLFSFGLAFRYLDSIHFKMDEHIEYALDGFQSAAIALVAQAAWKLSKNYKSSYLHLLLMLSSAVILYIFDNPYVMIILMASGGFLSLFLAQYSDQQFQKTNSKKKLIVENEQNTVVQDGEGPFGKTSLYVFLGFLIGLPVITFIIPSIDLLNYFSSFYSIGSIIVGGGHVILPLIKTDFEQYGLDEKEFWNGFSIVSALPGPLFNISIYVGAIIGGILSGIVCWVGLFLPAFLMIWGIIPFWHKYRKNPTIQKILKGVGASSIGFIITAVFLLWNAASEKDVSSSTLIAIASFVALHIYNCRAPLVVFVGGILMVCRQVVLVNYRGLPDN